MRYIFAIGLNLLIFVNLFGQENNFRIVTTDIDNFWRAYDQIITTTDNSKQLEYLNKEFIEKGTPGLKAIMQARRYTPQEYVEAINKRPEFWSSIREKTLKANEFAHDIEAGINKLKKLYPELKPANIYFTVGVFRTGGTTSENNILIGSEIVFADQRNIDNLVFTNVHEFVHTQQKVNNCDNLLGQSVMEGVAEFLTVKALETPSTAPAISFGKANEQRVKEVFAREMFNRYTNFWLYSDAPNIFNTRDLGYYVGYAIAEKYYEKAKDKKLAVKEMIELDYNNPIQLAKYVDKSGYFPKSTAKYEKDFEKIRPQVIGIKPFKNGDKRVSPSVSEITVEFSEEMNKTYRNFQFGPLGEEAVCRLKRFIGFSEDGKSVSFEIEPLKPNKHYQLVIGNGFRNKNGIAIKPFLIDFATTDK